MVAYLLCAGFGTRMRPLTTETPKSLLPVGDRLLIDPLMDELRAWHQLDAIHVAVNHRDAAPFRAWAARWRPTFSEEGITVEVHDDGVSSPDEQLGAVGDLQFLLEQTGLPSDGALVSGGDSLYRFPLSPLLNAFDGTRNRVLALYEPNPARRRHSSVLQWDGPRVTGLVEDPSASDSDRICPSWHLLTPSALATVGPYLDAGGDRDTLGTFIDTLARRDRVDAIRLPKRKQLRIHCNTPEDLARARTLLTEEPQYVLDADAIQHCLDGDSS